MYVVNSVHAISQRFFRLKAMSSSGYTQVTTFSSEDGIISNCNDVITDNVVISLKMYNETSYTLMFGTVDNTYSHFYKCVIF